MGRISTASWLARGARAALLLLALTLVALPGRPLAQDIVSIQGDQAVREATREQLFDALASAPNEASARRIVANIWLFWFEAPDSDAAELMRHAQQRWRGGDLDGAIAALDRLVEEAPGWAEAWNQRATLRFIAGDYRGSLDDIDHVLPLEPKHFGALSGQAMIFRRLGRKDDAQTVLKQAVKINPFLADRVLLEPEPEEREI